ncbi:MAG: B12-binding domain-containing radical SAM protein [Lentisphaerae bacterium]|nr:B12-binding domain-containing radical SAM protein [Lentisphaerota bacterium]
MAFSRHTLLFLQLPQLDNDTGGRHENLNVAAAYLRHALSRSGERRFFHARLLAPAADRLDDRRLVDAILASQPAILACTLYLWNIERTLHVLQRVRRQRPDIRIALGGPEVARRHPFLFASGIPDAVVVGEGEAVFPEILQAFRTGRRTSFRSVAWKTGRSYRWGTQMPPAVDLARCLPPPDDPWLAPDARGMAYLETTRGCPMTCTFCRYHHLRERVSSLPPNAVITRIEALKKQGVREIRFIDPTFNAHPHFEEILERIAAMNRRHSLKFFAELRADTLTPSQMALLARANFMELEVGVQSTQPEVLKAIRRPTEIPTRTIRALGRAGIRVTVDLMVGLPRQTLRDIYEAARWAATLRGAHIQWLQTLLLPGTIIREQRRRWRIQAQNRPPYAVLGTATLSPHALQQAVGLIHREAELDCPTRRFVGYRLPDLFPEQVRLRLDGCDPLISGVGCKPPKQDGHDGAWPSKIRPFWEGHTPCDRLQEGRADLLELGSRTTLRSKLSLRSTSPHELCDWLPGKENRRALIFVGADLYAQRHTLRNIIRQALTSEPHSLWQFVLNPLAEEPLDLVDALVSVIRAFPPHLLDRSLATDHGNRLASRRLFVQLSPGRRYARSWQDAAEALLQTVFW